MRHEHVHVVRVEPPQARLQGADHGLAAVAGRPGARSDVSRTGVLGDHHVVPSVLAEQLTEDGFRLSVLVEVGRVERRTARSDEAFEDLTGGLQTSASLGRAEVGGAERVLRHTQPSLPSEGFVTHGDSSMVAVVRGTLLAPSQKKGRVIHLMPKVAQAYLDARRKQIVEAARARFTSHGFAGTSMADIVTESGLSTGSIYRYFTSKDEIIIAVCEQGSEAFPSALTVEAVNDFLG